MTLVKLDIFRSNFQTHKTLHKLTTKQSARSTALVRIGAIRRGPLSSARRRDLLGRLLRLLGRRGVKITVILRSRSGADIDDSPRLLRLPHLLPDQSVAV